MAARPGARRRVLYFMGRFWRQLLLKIARSSARRTPRRKSRPPRESGTKFFDNRKAGKFTPRTLGGLRSACGSDGVDYYKFCSSMLSSAVDYKASSVKHLGNCGVDSPGAEQSDHGIMDPRETGRTSRRKVAV